MCVYIYIYTHTQQISTSFLFPGEIKVGDEVTVKAPDSCMHACDTTTTIIIILILIINHPSLSLSLYIMCIYIYIYIHICMSLSCKHTIDITHIMRPPIL